MSDQERELTPEQEADVRRLLAEARATEPVPPDVAARLDRVMVGLGEERGGDPRAPTAHVIAPDWRRRRATMLLVAAAAVVAVGFGIGQIDGLQGGGDSGSGGGGSADDAGVSAQRGKSADESGQERGSDGRLQASEAPTDSSVAPESASGDAPMPAEATPVGRVREASFTADANQLRRAFPDNPVDGEFVQLEGDHLPSGYVSTERAFECAPARWGAGVLVPVFFDGTAAVLAYRPVTGESQIVELLQCGTGEILRSSTLQAG